MASKSNSQAHKSSDTSEDKVDKILKTLPDLIKLLCPVKEGPLGGSEGKHEITKINDPAEEHISRSLSAPAAMTTHVAFDKELIEKLDYHFRHLKFSLAKLEHFRTNVGRDLDAHLSTLESLTKNSESYIKRDLEGIEKKISDLLYQVPLLPGKQEYQKAIAYGDQDDEDEDHQGEAYVYLPGIHTNVEDLTKLEVFRQVKDKFMVLSSRAKICLLSFAVFPENREVHRTMLMYWWIGEGYLPVEGAEQAVREILEEFTEKKLVEPVEERRKVAPNSYKMSPFVHSSVVLLSKEIGLIDIYHEGEKPTMKLSRMGKVCLVKGLSKQEAIDANRKIKEMQERIGTVFNVSERFPDFALKWFSKKTSFITSKTRNSLRVFYLGRWERSKNRHIRIETPQLMQFLKHMTKLRFLSFQGISAIRSLNSSVCKAHKLIILDLRECYDLKQLPEKIDSLQSLIYLDMTGCYMLEWIPFRVALLKNLEVLKGFVVSDEVYEGVACKLNYLKKLKKLRKLSIEVNRDDLGVEEIMEDLVEFSVLKSLKVTWRRDLRIIRGDITFEQVKSIIRTITFQEMKSDGERKDKRSLPEQLMKLDLQRYPHEDLPGWLHPRVLVGLKKLYIGGGRRLEGFGKLPEGPIECTVEVLRLTSLPKLKVGWIELKEHYFPKLAFLESYECPRVTLTPCDGSGIWRADQD